MQIKKIAVLTSGGDAPGMNAAIRAVVRTGIYYGYEMYGVKDGYKGLVNGDIFSMDSKSVSNIISKGGTILGSARLVEFAQKETRQIAIDNLNKLGIDALICIGGDGTYQGARELSKMGFKVIGIPATIDNDVSSTDKTIGFSTALQTIVDAIDKLRDTAESHQRCSIVETMGRRCGDLALHAGICCGAEIVITEETGFDKQKVLDLLKRKKESGRRHAVIVISENIANVHDFAKEIEEYSGYETRATVLGYVQRGGSPTPEDRVLASRMGEYAIELFNDEIDGCAVALIENELVHVDLKTATKRQIVKSKFYDLIEKIR